MSACLLLDPFQLYLEMPVLFGLSIYTATGNSCTFGNENVLLGIFCEGRDSNQKLVLQVIAERMKICTYLHVRNNTYPPDVF